MFSAAVMSYSTKSWKTAPIPRRSAPMSASRMSTPSHRIAPLVGS
jgi:hypothetical protein